MAQRRAHAGADGLVARGALEDQAGVRDGVVAGRAVPLVQDL